MSYRGGVLYRHENPHCRGRCRNDGDCEGVVRACNAHLAKMDARRERQAAAERGSPIRFTCDKWPTVSEIRRGILAAFLAKGLVPEDLA